MNCENYYGKLMLYKGCYILGPTGPQGLQGATGPIPKLTIGKVTTGSPGSEASVTITPTNKTHIHNKNIERK